MTPQPRKPQAHEPYVTALEKVGIKVAKTPRFHSDAKNGIQFWSYGLAHSKLKGAALVKAATAALPTRPPNVQFHIVVHGAERNKWHEGRTMKGDASLILDHSQG